MPVGVHSSSTSGPLSTILVVHTVSTVCTFNTLLSLLEITQLIKS